jgi:hypothetical protein
MSRINPAGSMSFRNLSHGVFAQLHHLFAKRQLEFVGKSFCESPVDLPCEVHSVTSARFT